MKFFVALVVVVLVAGFIFWDDFGTSDPEDGAIVDEQAGMDAQGGDEAAVEVMASSAGENATENAGLRNAGIGTGKESYKTLISQQKWQDALAALDAIPLERTGPDEEAARHLCLLHSGMKREADQVLDHLMKTTPDAGGTVDAVMQSLQEENISLMEKRRRLSRVMSGFGQLNAQQVIRLTREMKKINEGLPNSIQGLLQVEKYKVVPNDCLWNICKHFRKKLGFGIESGLLCRINGIRNDMIYPGQTLIIPKQQTKIKIYRNNWLLTVTAGDCLLAAYRVGLGKRDKTPLGQFMIKTRLENPDWYSDIKGKIIPFGDPENVLGTRWLGFENQENARGFGIHGTVEPDSIGKNMSSGCIRLLNEDVENLFDIIARGTPVEVM